MPPGASSSFIPKAALTKDQRPKRRAGGLLLTIGVMVLIISALAFGGVYGYRLILQSEINRPCAPDGTGATRCGLKATVERERQNIDQNTITSLQRLDGKLSIAERLIAEHQTILPVYRILEELTLPTISYRSFNYSAKAVSIDGIATSYEDIAVQTQVFSAEKKRIQSFIFSDLDQNAEGQVVFKLTMVLDPSVANYLKNQI